MDMLHDQAAAFNNRTAAIGITGCYHGCSQPHLAQVCLPAIIEASFLQIRGIRIRNAAIAVEVIISTILLNG